MCNLYDLGPAPERVRFDWEAGLRELLGELSYVAPGKTGLVARGSGGRFDPRSMRWGFQRSWSAAITNARDDKLEGPTWTEAWQQRRCVIPVRQFYEWSGVAGRKTKHAIRIAGDDGWFWIGGLWEEHPHMGLTYSMITTEACRPLAFLHGRMPLILSPDDLQEFVFADEPARSLVKPYSGGLLVHPPGPLPTEEPMELF